jgi:hypothetical protein
MKLEALLAFAHDEIETRDNCILELYSILEVLY